MNIHSVSDKSFEQYGTVLADLDCTELLEFLTQIEAPQKGISYVPSEPGLERCNVANTLQNGFYGEMPIQIGVCCGGNHTLNCLEYHRGSEINISDSDIILLLADKKKIKDGKIHTETVEAFQVPARTPIVLYETTLHFAPCGNRFKVIVVLPRGTNTPLEGKEHRSGENAMLLQKNKWLLAHPQSDEAAAGAYVGLVGENIVVKEKCQ